MPTLPRLHAFEFNDLDWIPSSLRDTIVESLSRALRWGGMLRGLVEPFSDFLAESGAREVLDLCAGAAGPAAILVAEMKAAGRTPPRFLMTDLYPRTNLWRAERARHPDAIDFVAEPVDATHIPEHLATGRARVVINAFHHFPPSLARAILADAVARGAGVFISEAFERNPLRFANFGPAGLTALAVNPLLSPTENVRKALLTWATPIALGASIWDGLVSTLRVYSEADLRAMAEELAPSWRWTYRHYPYPPLGRGYCFWGVPPTAAAAASAMSTTTGA